MFKKKYQKRVSPAVKSYVKSTIAKEIEVKYHDQAPGDITVSNSGSFYNMFSANNQGTSDFQNRIGDKISVKQIKLNFSIEIADTYNYMRCICFLWNHDNSISAPTVSEVLAGSANPLAPYNWDVIHQKRFTPIFDRVYNVDALAHSIIRVHKTIKFPRGKIIRFLGSGTTGTHIPYMLFISDSGAPTHPGIKLQYYRMTYTDA